MFSLEATFSIEIALNVFVSDQSATQATISTQAIETMYSSCAGMAAASGVLV